MDNTGLAVFYSKYFIKFFTKLFQRLKFWASKFSFDLTGLLKVSFAMQFGSYGNKQVTKQ